MKSKLLSLFLLTAILSVAMISAANFTVALSNDLTKSVNQTTLTITNTGTTNISVTMPDVADLNDGDNNVIALSQDVLAGNYDIAIGAKKEVKISHALADSDKEDLALGKFSEAITIKDATDATQTVSATLNFLSGFCELGELKENITDGDRYLEITSVSDKSSDTDWEWKPLDEVDIDVKVKFVSDDNGDSIDGIIKIGLYDTIDNTFIDLDNDEDTEISFSLDEGDSTTETFKISVPVEDLEDSTSRYKLYVKAYQEDDEDIVCTDRDGSDYFQDIEIKKDSYSVVLNKLAVTTPAPCNGEVEVTGTVYNVGSHDEDKTIVKIYNKDLGIDLTSDVFQLDQGDSQKFTFTFKVPVDADEKSYTLKLWTEFKYSKSSEEYREKSDDYSVILAVEGNCKVATPSASVLITAELDSETPAAVAGKQVIITANLKNTGDNETTYIISVLGNTAWSSLSAIDPKTLILAPGESKDVSIYLDIDKDATGEKEFTIEASYNGRITSQKVALALEEGVSQDVLLNHLRANWFIYVIVIINIILIIAIIAVVRSMVRSPSR